MGRPGDTRSILAVQALAKFIRIALHTSDTGGQRASVNENVSGRHETLAHYDGPIAGPSTLLKDQDGEKTATISVRSSGEIRQNHITSSAPVRPKTKYKHRDATEAPNNIPATAMTAMHIAAIRASFLMAFRASGKSRQVIT